MTKRFKFPIRTTEEGSAVPGGNYEVTTDIDSIELFTEPASMKMPIWTFKK
ncbi:aprB domain protein [Desulfosporosinus sp. OT]|nr:aprB domain protein [Desulfosporosinus sp. OT]